MKLYLTLLCMIFAVAATAQSALISVDDFKDLPKDQKIEQYDNAKLMLEEAIDTHGINSSEATGLQQQFNDIADYVAERRAAKKASTPGASKNVQANAERQKYYDAVAKYGKDSKEAMAVRKQVTEKLKQKETNQ